jgi:dihydropteroate synthase
MTPKLVGILNLTPDSFSDGGRYAEPLKALKHIEDMAAQGAAIVDIGAESTRPGATLLSPGEEWARLAPVLEAFPGEKLPCAISIDTRHASTARKALALGVDWINDVSGLQDKEFRRVLADSRCKVVLMHSLGVPADKNRVMPENMDVIGALVEWAAARAAALEADGIERHRLIFDPGIGFGKTAAQSLTILRRAGELKALRLPLLFGHSRKSFLTEVTRNKVEDRDKETSELSAYLAGLQVDYLRVHHIKANMMAIHNPTAKPAWL